MFESLKNQYSVVVKTSNVLVCSQPGCSSDSPCSHYKSYVTDMEICHEKDTQRQHDHSNRKLVGK